MNIPASLKSRKFWLTVSGIAAAFGAAFGGEMTWAQAVAAIVALITQYSAANVIEARGHDAPAPSPDATQ